jgi:hypothetical protein
VGHSVFLLAYCLVCDLSDYFVLSKQFTDWNGLKTSHQNTLVPYVTSFSGRERKRVSRSAKDRKYWKGKNNNLGIASDHNLIKLSHDN